MAGGGFVWCCVFGCERLCVTLHTLRDDAEPAPTNNIHVLLPRFQHQLPEAIYRGM